jgi:hypothetical protein
LKLCNKLYIARLEVLGMPFFVSWIARCRQQAGIAALLLLIGCGNPETGTFSGAASEKAAAEKGIKGPGPGATQTPVKASVARTKKGLVRREPGGGTPSPD